MARRLIKGLLITAAISTFVMAGVFAFQRAQMGPAEGIGIRDGRLADCPPTPNCVSSLADEDVQRVDPLVFDGDPAVAIARLRRLVDAMPRMRTVDATPDYLHVEATTRVWRYVDDVEFHIDPEAGKIHVRSASRIGDSDLGANHRRLRQIAEAYQQAK